MLIMTPPPYTTEISTLELRSKTPSLTELVGVHRRSRGILDGRIPIQWASILLLLVHQRCSSRKVAT